MPAMTVTEVKQFACLANSRKLSGRCIAGREWNDGRAGSWVRPVSAREKQEVSEYERQYRDGSDPRVLDILRVPVLEHRPEGYQRENWLLDPDRYWTKVGRLPREHLSHLVAPVAPLWIDGHSSHNGLNDRIPLATLAQVGESLRLIRVEGVRLTVFAPGEAFGNTKRRVQGGFAHAGVAYALWITDPEIERSYLARQNGVYPIDGAYLTVSLGEPFGDYGYKLIAAILPEGGDIQ